MGAARDLKSLLNGAKNVNALTDHYQAALDRILRELAAGVSRPGAARATALMREIHRQIDDLDPRKASYVRNWIRREIPRAFVLGDRNATQDLQKQLNAVTSEKAGEFGSVNRTFNATNQTAMKAVTIAMETKLTDAANQMRTRFGLVIRQTQQTLVSEASLRSQTVGGIIRGATGRAIADDLASLLLGDKVPKQTRDRLRDVGFRGDMFEEFERVARGELIQVGKRRLSVRSYADLVARTQEREAHKVATVVRLQQNGVDHVRISRHRQDKPDECTPFAGKVFYVGPLPQDPQGFPSLKGTVNSGPPFHPQCLHTVEPFVVAFKSAAAMTEARESAQALPRRFFGKSASEVRTLVAELGDKDLKIVAREGFEDLEAA